jgi:hypothetical protein
MEATTAVGDDSAQESASAGRVIEQEASELDPEVVHAGRPPSHRQSVSLLRKNKEKASRFRAGRMSTLMNRPYRLLIDTIQMLLR